MNKIEMFAQLFGILGSISMILLLYIMSGILTYNSIIDCLPILATLVYTIFLWQDNIQRIRIGSSIMFSMWMVYDRVVKAYFEAFFECLLLITSILSIIKLKRVTDDKIIKI